MITICDQDDFLLNKIIIDKLSMENIDLIGNHRISFEHFHPSCLGAWHMNKSSFLTAMPLSLNMKRNLSLARCQYRQWSL